MRRFGRSLSLPAGRYPLRANHGHQLRAIHGSITYAIARYPRMLDRFACERREESVRLDLSAS